MQRFEHTGDRARGNARGFAALEPGRAGPRPKEGREDRDELLAVDDARSVRREARIRREILPAEHLSTERLELAIRPDGEKKAAV